MAGSPSQPAFLPHAASVTPSDATVFVHPSAIYVGTAGAVAVVTEGGDTVTITTANNGEYLGCMVKQVLATGTTASGIVRYW